MRSEFELKIADSVRANSAVFLRRAAAELVADYSYDDAPLQQERATVVTAFTQMSLELALVSFLIRNNGIRCIIQGASSLTDQEIETKWQNNTLRTQRFEDNKKLLEDTSPDIYDFFEGLIDDFQRKRNKIVHFHYSFDDGDLYDVKYEAASILVHLVSKLMYGHEDSVDYPEKLKALLSDDLFANLVRFPPYVHYVADIAAENSNKVLTCIECDQVTFSDLEMKCFACTFEYRDGELINCPSCGETAVLFDNLNIDINDSVPALCLSCGIRSSAFQCKECDLISAAFALNDCRYCSDEEGAAEPTPGHALPAVQPKII
ncbi:hypothetical protein HFN11_29240 [Rhizobium leguminosarum]|uniref:hypothetical protein n=1 Tax=Rhizobium leguminosarum TaxID=384 RepID=UPI001C96F946|nr:hypothetical protein [Rhizobium leguminosarum]MBY5324349.1 hypothetical protein [Rhizobium leguminosarum]